MDNGNSLHQLFVYGTLKSGEPNYKLLLDPENGSSHFLGTAVTKKKWPLVIASRFNIPFLLYCEGTGYNVRGELYAIDDKMLQKMDQLENHPEYYERLKEVVLLKPVDGSPDLELQVWIYFLRNFKNLLLELPPMEDYSSLGPHGLQYVEKYARVVPTGFQYNICDVRDCKSETTSDTEDIYD